MRDANIQTIERLLGRNGLYVAAEFAIDYAIDGSDAYRLFANLALASERAGLRFDLTAPVLSIIRRQAEEMIALGQPVDCHQIKLEP